MKKDTPQEVIYKAWKKTKKPVLYETKDAKGKQIIKEVYFAVPQENQNYDEFYEGKCNLCGEETCNEQGME